MDHQLHSTDAHRTKFKATDVEDVESDLVALADFTEQVFNWRANIRENQRGSARSLDAHLVFFRTRGQSRLSLNNKRAELVAINLGKHDKDVGETTVGDPHLLPVENVLLAIVAQSRRCLCRHCV